MSDLLALAAVRPRHRSEDKRCVGEQERPAHGRNVRAEPLGRGERQRRDTRHGDDQHGLDTQVQQCGDALDGKRHPEP